VRTCDDERVDDDEEPPGERVRLDADDERLLRAPLPDALLDELRELGMAG
jgi:hypothetical protein